MSKWFIASIPSHAARPNALFTWPQALAESAVDQRPHQRVIRVRQADIHSKLLRHPGDIPMEPDGVESQSVREGGDHVLRS